MYQRFFIVIFSLFLLILSAVVQDLGRGNTFARHQQHKCQDRLLPVEHGGAFSNLVHESIPNCRK